MSWKAYEANCPGCRPCVIDVKTGKPFPQDSEVMRAVNKVFDSASLKEKQAFHNTTCNNSRDEMDLALMSGLLSKIEEVWKRN